MRYLIKEKFFSLGQSFTIQDDKGQTAYKVDGKLLSLKDKLTVRDASGAEVARIEQKLLSLVKAYRVYKGGSVIATIKKRPFTILRDRFVVDVPGPDDLVITGAILDHDYTVTRGKQQVARVSKAWVSLTDTYGIEVEEGEDPLLPIAAAIVIDLVIHERSGNED
ncbi:MAG: hypothetical protein ACI8S6_002186 [Myxococcota bacterium]|jgi:uncharacterized protein YxjI